MDDIVVLCLVKGEERYALAFDVDDCAPAYRLLGRWASDPDLAFSWYDAAVMSKRIRESTHGVARI